MSAGSDADARGLTGATNPVGRWRRVAAAAAATFCLVALSILALNTLLPQRTGPLVFGEVFEPYLLLLLAGAGATLALVARLRVSTAVLAVVLIAATVRYAPSLVSFPAGLPRDAMPLHVMSWNLEAGGVSAEQLASTIDRARPDIVGLIELVPGGSRAADQDARLQALFPYRVMLPRSGTPGLGLLSRFPVIEKRFITEPPLLRVVVARSAVDPPITVFVAHPYLSGIDSGAPVPIIDTESRDAGISLVRAAIDADLAAGHDVIVLGDFNVTEREPAYAELTRGLHDAQHESGYGLGLTWRPAVLERLPFGLLRIDYVLASDAFVAIAAGPDCTPRGSDHCLVTATFGRPRTR